MQAQYGLLKIIVTAEEKNINGPKESALFEAFEELASDLEEFARKYNRLHSEGGLTIKIEEVD